MFYAVVCLKPCNINDENNCVEESCGSDVSYIPNKEGLNVTQVMVTNLLSFMNYTFKVYAMNRVSEVAKRKHGVEGNFTTITMRTTGTSEFVKFVEYTVSLHSNQVLRAFYLNYFNFWTVFYQIGHLTSSVGNLLIQIVRIYCPDEGYGRERKFFGLAMNLRIYLLSLPF